MDAFSDWMKAPQGSWPLARIPDADALALGSKPRIASLSAETAAKQEREHPELLGLDYLMAQRAVDMATRRIQDGPNTLIYVQAEAGASGYVLVVKVTKSGDGLFVTSFRRLSADQVEADRTVRRLLRKGKD
ncbi:hypothetical protein [Paracoccus sp. IB05]|uniref:hypothetical protein n=1 Tax=Paracoccus sp. IB05 TaxID=2779367 RepID=UPI0018E84CEE|nr:hypothetical protein [Paracoccus sp. IB05]MBJ2150614.1 hypothetical protein [Paracoccus sp. IB05]